jgi:hypothetical protein
MKLKLSPFVLLTSVDSRSYDTRNVPYDKYLLVDDYLTTDFIIYLYSLLVLRFNTASCLISLYTFHNKFNYRFSPTATCTEPNQVLKLNSHFHLD